MSLRNSGEYEWLMFEVCAVCGLGFASAMLPWLEVVVGQVLVVLAVAGLLAYAMWWMQRWLRECREDRADIAHVNAVLAARARADQSRTEDLPIGGQR